MIAVRANTLMLYGGTNGVSRAMRRGVARRRSPARTAASPCAFAKVRPMITFGHSAEHVEEALAGEVDVGLVQEHHRAGRKRERHASDVLPGDRHARRVVGAGQEHDARVRRDGVDRLLEPETRSPGGASPRRCAPRRRWRTRRTCRRPVRRSPRRAASRPRPRCRYANDTAWMPSSRPLTSCTWSGPDAEVRRAALVRLGVVGVVGGVLAREPAQRLDHARRAAGGVLVEVEAQAVARDRAGARRRSSCQSHPDRLAWACSPSASASVDHRRRDARQPAPRQTSARC